MVKWGIREGQRDVTQENGLPLVVANQFPVGQRQVQWATNEATFRLLFTTNFETFHCRSSRSAGSTGKTREARQERR